MQLRDALMLLDRPARQFPPRVRQYFDARRFLRIEPDSTTLVGHGAMGIIRQVSNAGYQTLLVYVSLGDPELHIEPVRIQVS